METSKNFWQGKRVLITGGSGFIGSHLTRELVRRGATLLLLTHNPHQSWRINSILSSVKQAHWTDALNLADVMQGFDPQFVFHLATYRNVGRSADLIEPMMEANLARTQHLAKAALASARSLRLFVNTGTCEEYGNLPAPFSESMREKPVSPYSLGKTLAIQSIDFLSRIAHLPAINVRPFTTFGGWQVADMLIPQVITHLLEGEEFPMSAGDQTRDFIYVEDVVDAYLHLAEFKTRDSNAPQGEIYNIATGVESRVKEVVAQIAEMIGGKAMIQFGSRPLREGEPIHFFADVSRINQTGWRAKTSLIEGLSRTIGWYREHYQTFRNQLLPIVR